MASHSVNKANTRMERVAWGKVRSYNEIIEFLEKNTFYEYSENSVKRMKQLDEAFNFISHSINTILVTGTNGKSSTIHCALKLFRFEKYKVGAFFSSHYLTFNEHILTNGLLISNKKFAEVLNSVINISERDDIKATTYELLLMASFVCFRDEGLDATIIEVHSKGKYDAANFASPKITAITRIAANEEVSEKQADQIMYDMIELARPNQWCIAAEQSKLRLYKMKEWCEARNIYWMMPVRKLAQLPYIYAQLFGRSATLAERIVHLYVEQVKKSFSAFLKGNILVLPEDQRSRPTYETKKLTEKFNSTKHHMTLKRFWSEAFSLPRGCFEYLDKEKPGVLIDSSYNCDAFDNIFLGVRLLHYQRPIKKCTILFSPRKSANLDLLLKQIRYLLKKINGILVTFPLPETFSENIYNEDEVYNHAEKLLIPVKKMSSYELAFDEAEFTTDDRAGLIVLLGSPELVITYWKMKGMKKLS